MTLPNTGKKSLTSFQAGRTIDIHNDSLLYFIEILKFRKRENISFKNIFKYYYKSKIIVGEKRVDSIFSRIVTHIWMAIS